MSREIPVLLIRLAQSRIELNDYQKARDLLTQAVGDGSGKDAPDAQILLGMTEARLGRFEAARAALERALSGINASGALDLLPELHEVWGEYGVLSGQLPEAKAHFSSASALWKNDLPNPASVAARANLALLDVLEGRGQGRSAAQASLAKARQIGALSLIARCRIGLGRIQLKQRLFPEAIELTAPTKADDVLGPELRAELHYWHGEALKANGDSKGADAEKVIVRQLLDSVSSALPAEDRAGFMTRADIQILTQ
jgi:tetratricopeptide (TPR) repeat protein